MYGKIYKSIYDGTLGEDWRALITFQQMIVLCDADGIIDMTHNSISRRTGIPIEHIIAGIDILETADQRSRSPESEGRRIERLDAHRDWGWIIINHNVYRSLKDSDTVREQTRLRVRKHRESKNVTLCNANVTLCNANVTGGNAVTLQVTHGNAKKRHTDTDTDTDNIVIDKSITRAPNVPPYEKIVELYENVLPELPGIAKLTKVRKTRIKNLWLDELSTLDRWRNFFNHVRESKFLMGTTGHGNWRASLEWITHPTNFIKIKECHYHEQS